MSSKALAPMAVAVQAGVPVVVIGGPGSGKSVNIHAFGDAIDRHTECIIASLREPSDYAGLPIVTPQGVKLAPPAWAVRINESKRKGLVFHDEISTAAPAVQAALLRVIHENVVGELVLKPGVSHVAAMNPPEQAAGGWEMSAPLANRFCHIEWVVNTEDWINGMIQGFPTPSFPIVPDEWQAALPETRTLVASFIKHKPTHLNIVPKTDAEASKPWPSPRSWHMASKLMAASKAAACGKDVTLPLVAGCIGQGLALEFLNWLDSLDLPDPEHLLKNPSTFKVPERGDIAYTVLASVATCAATKMTKERFVAAWEIFGIAANAGKKDYAAAAVRALAKATSEKGFMGDPAVAKAIEKNLKPFIELLKAAGLLGGK